MDIPNVYSTVYLLGCEAGIEANKDDSLGLFQAITSYYVLHCKTLAWEEIL
jgi:hypothetical protein